MFSDADAVEQQGTLCFASPYRDFLKVANLTFLLGWEIVDKGTQVDSHRHENRDIDVERRWGLSDVSINFYPLSRIFHFTLDLVQFHFFLKI